MTDLFKLILGILTSRLKARATLEAENLVLRQQVNVLVGVRQSDRTSTIRIVFYLFGSIAGFRPSLRWLRLSGRRPSFAGTVLGFGRQPWQALRAGGRSGHLHSHKLTRVNLVVRHGGTSPNG